MFQPVSASLDVLSILSAAPNSYLILLPDAPHFTIVAVTDAYLKATFTVRDEMVGRGLFEVFPGNPSLSNGSAVKNLRASLNHVLQHKTEHRMADQRYDVINPRLGEFAYKVWRTLNKPVPGSTGAVQYIIHCVEEVTDTYRTQEQVEQKEEQLRASEDLFKAALDSSLDFIQVFQAVRNGKGKIVDFTWVLTNHKWNERYGEVIGKSLLQQNPAVVETGVFDRFVQVTETGVPQQQEHYYAHGQFDGWFAQAIVKLNDGVIMTTEDITERKKAEQEVLRMKDELAQRAADKYLTLFNSMDEGFALCELVRNNKGVAVDYRALELNPAYEKQTGVKIEQRLGRTAGEVFPALDEWWVKTYAAVVDKKQSVQFERYSKENNRWYDIAAYPMQGDQFAVFYNDITERKMAAEAARQAEENYCTQLEREVELRTLELVASNKLLAEEHYFLEQVTNKTPHLIYVFDLDEQRFTYMNSRVFQLVGRDQDYVYAMGAHLFQAILHPDDLSLREDYMAGLYTLGEGEIRENEVRLWTGNAFRWFRFKDSVFKKEDGLVKQVIGLAEDVTYEKMMQEKIQREGGHIGMN